MDNTIGKAVRWLIIGLGIGVGVVVGAGYVWVEVTDPGALPKAETCIRASSPQTLIAEFLTTSNDIVDINPDAPASDVCANIDAQLDSLLFAEPGGFLFTKRTFDLTNSTHQLDWTDDGCSFAPVRDGGPFGFLGACLRHDFGWRNPRGLDQPGVETWNVISKTRADLGFLYDMRLACSAQAYTVRPFCELSARIFYMFVDLNWAGLRPFDNLLGP